MLKLSLAASQNGYYSKSFENPAYFDYYTIFRACFKQSSTKKIIPKASKILPILTIIPYFVPI